MGIYFRVLPVHIEAALNSTSVFPKVLDIPHGVQWWGGSINSSCY